MAKRGRPRKNPPLGSIEVVKTKVDHAKVLKQFEQEQRIQLEALYKKLAEIKLLINNALARVGTIDGAERLSEAAFYAGKAYGDIDKADNILYDMLEEMYDNNDLDHWDDVLDNN